MKVSSLLIVQNGHSCMNWWVGSIKGCGHKFCLHELVSNLDRVPQINPVEGSSLVSRCYSVSYHTSTCSVFSCMHKDILEL